MDRLPIKKDFPYVINLLGRTGDGKTQFTKYLASLFQPSQEHRFQPSARADSHTQDISSLTFEGFPLGSFKVNDTPGALTSQGTKADEDNIAKIINFCKNLGYFNSNLLIFSESNRLLDKAMQDVIKLFVECFGVESLRNTGILYTRSCGSTERSELRDHALSIAQMLKTHFGLLEVPPIPFFTVESVPNSPYLLRTKQVESIQQANLTEISQILRWTCANKQISTKDVVVRNYDWRREQIQLEMERKRLIENNRVVREWPETDVGGEIFVCSEPITQQQIQKFKRKKKFLGFRTGINTTDQRTITVTVGSRNYYKRAILFRTNQELGSGKISYGNWVVTGYGPKYYRENRF